MKKYLKRLFVLLLVATFLFPIAKVFAYFDEGDSTITVRVDGGNGCFYIETDEAEEHTCSTGTYHVPGGTEVTLRGEPEEGYHVDGWFNFREEVVQGETEYPTDGPPLTADHNYTFTAAENGNYSIAVRFEVGTELPEIRFTGNIPTESLMVGELPQFTIATTTAHATIDDDNSNWARKPEGYENWNSSFDTNPPEAAADGTFYATRAAVDLSDGYVFTHNTTVYYNDRDMTDTYTTVSRQEWGGYVFLDLGQVFDNNGPGEGPAVEGNIIRKVVLNIDMPRIGDNIELVDTDERFFQTQYEIAIPEEDIDYYGLDGDEEHNYMVIYEPGATVAFSGELQANHTYGMDLWLVAFEGYTFADDLDLYINDGRVNTFVVEDNILLSVNYMFEPEEPDVTYNIESEDGSAIAIFNSHEGDNFTLSFVDILSHTPEEIEAMFGVPAEYIEEVVETITDSVKEYGNLIGVYAIEIQGNNFNFSDAVTLRIKMTDEMKQYNTFKFLFLDENNEFAIEEVHDVVVDEDGYLVVDLNHLSAYALVGMNVETPTNPSTGDKIVFYGSMLGLCTLGLVGIGIYTKKKYFNKIEKQD